MDFSILFPLECRYRPRDHRSLARIGAHRPSVERVASAPPGVRLRLWIACRELVIMRKSLAYISLACTALALSACGKSATEEKADRSAALEKAAEVAFQMQPGKYRTTVAVQKVDIPGMPAEMAAQMKAMMSKGSTSESCITSDKAVKGVELMKEQMAKGQCNFDKFDAVGGTVDASFTCKSGDQMTLKATSKGTYTPTGSVIVATGEMAGPGGKTMHIEHVITTERIGDCA